MAKLHFKYATMNSGKTIDLIRTAYNYEENNYKVLICKPKIDTKSNENIETRIGLKRKADVLIDDSSMLDLFKGKLGEVACIFIDESQFLNKNQIDELYIITKALDIPVICYGIRNDFQMTSFEGSRRLLELADKLEELKTLCNCGRVARQIGRKIDNDFVLEGDKIMIDGSNERIEYVPLCGKCYLEKVKKLDLNQYRRKVH